MQIFYISYVLVCFADRVSLPLAALNNVCKYVCVYVQFVIIFYSEDQMKTVVEPPSKVGEFIGQTN